MLIFDISDFLIGHYSLSLKLPAFSSKNNQEQILSFLDKNLKESVTHKKTHSFFYIFILKPINIFKVTI